MPTRTPARYDIAVIQGASWTFPLRILASGVLIDTSDYTARMQIRGAIDDQTPVIDLTVANGGMEVGFDPPKFVASAVYALDQQVVPTALNGFYYQVTIAGTAGAEPSWPTVIGNTVASGSVTFRCQAADTTVTNVRAVIEPAESTALEDWGLGRFDLELVDPFGHVTRVIEGAAVLSREVTR